MPAGGSRAPATAETVAERQHFAKMNGREVFKFATRVLVDSAEKVLDECGVPVDESTSTCRIRRTCGSSTTRGGSSASRKSGQSSTSTAIGNTSSGSIPLALGDAEADGRLTPGEMVLMTGMGAGLTWGSALIEWTANGKGGQR